MQIVGYRTGPEAPALLLAEDGRVSRRPLETGADLAYPLGGRHCAGAVQGETHLPCDAGRAPYCEAHTESWALANNADSEEEHAVYLAAFAPRTFKVGVTRTWRLETRLREQGADRAAHVDTAPDGRSAREREAAIASETVPDRVRVPTKVAGFARQVDAEAWADLLAGFDVRERYDFDYGLDLATRPVAETLATGTVRGVKGRVLVLDRTGTTYAVDLRDLVGYEVSDRDRRPRQASLAAYRLEE